MGHWNHRILCGIYDGEEFLKIHEVYYDDDGKINGYGENSVSIYSEEGLEGVKWQLEMMAKALDKPILWRGDRFPEEYKTEEI